MNMYFVIVKQCTFLLLISTLAIAAQLNGGLLDILKPEGLQVSVPGLLGIGGNKKTTTTTSTTTTTTEAPTKATKRPNRKTVAPCEYTQTIVNGKRSCKGKLILQDNFGKIAEKKWLIENRFAGKPDYEFTLYQNNPENIYAKKNFLHIRPTLLERKYGAGYVSGEEELNLGDSCTGAPSTSECVQTPRAWQILPPTISAQISSRDHSCFVYGVVEIRARLPEGDWIYPELYLKPKSNFYGSGYDSGLIRIAFAPGNTELSKNLSGGIILGQSNPARAYGIKTIQSEKHWNRDFHVFKVVWKPDSITLSVDDKVYGNIQTPDDGFYGEAAKLEVENETIQKWKRGSKFAPFDKEMCIVLGVGVGGFNFQENDKPWNNDDPKAQLSFYRKQDLWSQTWGDDSELLVDHVKVWAL